MKTSSALFCLIFAFCITLLITAKAQVNANDSLVLVDLYNSTKGASWLRDDNWLTGPVKDWYGISLSNNGKRVTSIELYQNNLTGFIPSSIGNLANLSVIDLSSNRLNGNIPPELGNFSFIPGNYYTFLDLSHNQLSGHIPPGLGNISNINYLLLNDNQLNGPIPKELGTISFNGDYSILNLSNNHLSGHIPSELGNLNIYYLFLHNNQLSGPIPSSIARLNYLASLDLSHNMFTFDGMELVAQSVPFAKYNRQAIIPVHLSNNTLSVSAGGTLSNNTYLWYKLGKQGNRSITGDSVFHPTESGVYFVKVKNKIIKGLNLVSDPIRYSAPPSFNAVASNNQLKFLNNHFSVYPNPVKDILHVKTSGNTSVSLLSRNGEILVTQSINKTGSINLSIIATGVYYLKNNTTKAVEKIYIVR